MRDGNFFTFAFFLALCRVVSLPMRDGNSPDKLSNLMNKAVVSLPMRDGNSVPAQSPGRSIPLLAYL